MIYSINGEVDQHICMKINEDFAFPEKIKLTRAVLYTFQPKTAQTGVERWNW